MPGVGRFPPAPAPGRAPGAPAGRGAPGRAPAAPAGRGAPGRGPPAPAAGRGPPGRSPSVRLPPGRGMPWEGANGLLPGRGGRSLSPPRPRGMPWDVAKGLLPGRGPPGRGAEPWRAGAAGASAFGAGLAPGLTPVEGAAGAAGAWAAGAAGAAGAGAAGAGAAGAWAAGAAGAAGAAAGASALGSAALGAAGPGAGAVRGAAGLADALGADAGASDFEAPAASGNALRSFLTTGASMVEEAERTNSPSSCSFVTASLEVIPSSFASSCTRTLATFLLSRSAPSQARTVYFLLRTSAASAAERSIAERNKVVIVAHSSLGTHRVSISFLTRFQVGRLLLRPPECPRLSCLPLSGVRRRLLRMRR
jgi:hypothetical protein